MKADEETATADNSGKSASMNAPEAIRYDWGSAYEIERDGDEWRARRHDGLGGWMDADSDDLRTQIFSDYAIKPVRQPLSS
jgi:hypothetical protein